MMKDSDLSEIRDALASAGSGLKKIKKSELMSANIKFAILSIAFSVSLITTIGASAPVITLCIFLQGIYFFGLIVTKRVFTVLLISFLLHIFLGIFYNVLIVKTGLSEDLDSWIKTSILKESIAMDNPAINIQSIDKGIIKNTAKLYEALFLSGSLLLNKKDFDSVLATKKSPEEIRELIDSYNKIHDSILIASKNLYKMQNELSNSLKNENENENENDLLDQNNLDLYKQDQNNVQNNNMDKIDTTTVVDVDLIKNGDNLYATIKLGRNQVSSFIKVPLGYDVGVRTVSGNFTIYHNGIKYLVSGINKVSLPEVLSPGFILYPDPRISETVISIILSPKPGYNQRPDKHENGNVVQYARLI